ncbi:UBX domain-containing protein 7 [Harpegnathos saltator]|uniref:UBX domain-containing protein 7 n=1 Tax=Harpegnathos saltator TaxID=610380 RepID=E2BC91_HARSA|nr:UBX domain-containing protein 7 [Harpegnathos saltator]EFN86627.1 UBX domain-containing protein 7 [Harpegnathos saltator]
MDRELVEKFIEVTGESEATAQQYLSLADGNVEMAISLMFESGRPLENENVNADPAVRAPILPTQEILVPSEPVCSFPRISNNVFDRFRDFAVETQRQEEEMTRRVSGMKHICQRKSKRLEDLFRPPCNILFLGSFMEARDHAKTLNRWLLVNVQNPQEFSCQVLNRDVWPNQQIQEIVKDHFVLWQVLSNTSDGRRYIDFYNVVEYPYLAIIDPRTGECMRTYNNISVDSLISGLNDMLSTHASPESASQDTSNSKDWNNFPTSPPKRNILNDQIKNDCGPSSKTSRLLSENVIDSENENMLSDNITSSSVPSSSSSSSSSNSNSSSGSSSSNTIINKKRRLEECDIDKPQQKTEKLKPSTAKAGIGDEPFLRLCLRLPNGTRETISICATETIEDFLIKMEEMGFPPTEHTYLVPYPKTNVGALSPNIRLLDTILFPANTVFITKI